MPDLHDQYQTLLRRGMPKPDFYYTLYAQTTAGFTAKCPEGGFWSAMRSKEVAHRLHGLKDEHARDLLTMHALRWVLSFDVHYSHCKDCPDGGEHTFYWNTDSRDNDGDGATILDAIIEATKHLEPNNA